MQARRLFADFRGGGPPRCSNSMPEVATGWKLRCIWFGALMMISAGMYGCGAVARWASTPPGRFHEYVPPAEPDCARAENWAALPWVHSPAEEVPLGVAVVGEAQRPADVFFVHPTTHFARNGSAVSRRSAPQPARSTRYIRPLRPVVHVVHRWSPDELVGAGLARSPTLRARAAALV
jgi:hypothetical protein